MKKILLLACSIGALLACNREDTAGLTDPEEIPEINISSQGTVPVHLRISRGITTKGTVANEKESEITNALLTVRGMESEESAVLYTDTYDVSESADVIVNLKPCDYAIFTVESGTMNEGKMLTDLADQKIHYYAKGEIQMEWEDLQEEGATHVIELIRQINKITIEKISVDWNNNNYTGKEFRIKRIYLCDVPRYPASTYAETVESAYKQSYGGTKVSFNYYNFNGLESFVYNNKQYDFVADIHRLDDQLLDEVDSTISEDKPYQTQHVFYSYLSNNGNTIPQMKFAQADRYAFIPPMTTIVIEAEMDGALMYYRFPILQSKDGSILSEIPVNTHIRFKELIITDLGSPTLYGDKTFENVNFSLADWTDDERTDPTTNL